MDSFIQKKLAQAQAKLQKAAKYIPKDIMKNIPGRKKEQNNNPQEEDQADIGDQFVEVEGIQDYQPNMQDNIKKKATGILKGIKGKIEEVKKNWRPQQIDDHFLEAISEDVVEEKETIIVSLPPPEEACNSVVKRLLQSKQIENQTSLKIKSQAAKIVYQLNQKEIDLKSLQAVAFNGIPDEIKGIRPLVWRILLKHFPTTTSDWDNHLEVAKETYESWRQELIIKPSIKAQEEERASMKQVIDHPLSTNYNSQWNKFFKDQDLWDEIEKDVKRTRTDLSFFYKALDDSQNNQIDQLMKQAECKKSELTPADRLAYIETHADVLARVLFIYAKLNPGIKYVQGMNEVLAVIYYCFWSFSDFTVISVEYLESDLFFCFTNLMTEIRDGFMRDMDKEESGISGQVQAFANVLKIIDPKVYNNLEAQQVNHQFYSLRWLMLLMCQEFDMSNVIRLWDTLFSDPERFNYLNFICVALVQTKRDICIEGDFAECMETLQRAADSITDIRFLLDDAKVVLQKYIQIQKSDQQWVDLNLSKKKKDSFM